MEEGVGEALLQPGYRCKIIQGCNLHIEKGVKSYELISPEKQLTVLLGRRHALEKRMGAAEQRAFSLIVLVSGGATPNRQDRIMGIGGAPEKLGLFYGQNGWVIVRQGAVIVSFVLKYRCRKQKWHR